MSLKHNILFFLIIICNNVFAQTRSKELEKYFTQLFNNQQFNGNVLIAEKGNVVYKGSFGYADISTKRLNTGNTSFPIASITKTFTSTAVLQLKEKGKLKLSDPVVNYLPDFAYPTVTIKHLLSHTAGLPIYDTLFFSILPEHPDTVFTNANLIAAFKKTKAPLVFQPGTDFSYNNVNYNILALLVEKVSGLSFGDYLEKFIFRPSEMSSTSLSKFYVRKDENLSKLYRARYPFSATVERADTASEYKIMYNFNFYGHGDVISTTSDLFKYDLALQRGSLLNQTSLKEAFTPVKLSNGKDNVQRYGLGWMINEDRSLGEIVKHDGGLPGGRTLFLKNITKQQTIILFDNHSNNVIPLAEDAIKILNGLQVANPKKSGAKAYGIALASQGIEAGKKTLVRIKKDSSAYYVSEDELNSLAYALWGSKKIELAEEVFKTNTLLFPASWNTYDSYGEVLLAIGKRQDAIQMYKKSVELNPKNENGIHVLKQLSQ